MEQYGYCSKSELPDYLMIENPLNCARMRTMASQFCTLIKHAFSTNRSARYITTLLSNMLPKLNVRSFIILRSGEGLTSFIKINCVNFSGEKKYIEGYRSLYCLRIREKNFTQNLVLKFKGLLSRENRSDFISLSRIFLYSPILTHLYSNV